MKNQWDFILDLMKLFSFTFCIFHSKYILTVVVTAWHFFISSLVNCEQPSKKSEYSVLTTILTMLSNNFLSQIDLGYVQLIKVTAPDGTIPIKPFNIT